MEGGIDRGMRKSCSSAQRSNCPVSQVLEQIGDRWSLLIIRDMIFLGKTEYCDFLNSEEKISTNILASRLKEMVETGLITKSRHPNDGKRFLYHITDKGIELTPLLLELLLWGKKHFPGTTIPEEMILGMKNGREQFIDDCMRKVRDRRDRV